jgi:fatty-acyl-CoA synthase
MTVGMLEWLFEPKSDRGIRFATDDEREWDLWTYERLASATWSAAAQLIDAGVAPGDIVAIIVPTGPGFVAAFCATLAVGATPAPLVPPTLFESDTHYVTHTGMLIGAAAAIVVTEAGLVGLVRRASDAGGLQRPPLVLDLTAAPAGPIRRAPAALALLQFTSGSSGTPRGVRVTYRNLESNIAMIRDWIDWGPDDAGAHWLPLYHDMGLIGCFLTPLVHQRDLWILRPEQFVLAPKRWLDCFGRGPAVFTAGPNFCFAYAASRIDPASLVGSDFSHWKSAFVAAERLDPSALGKFTRMLEPYGFQPSVFLPAYGMAEATLAVTGVPPKRVPNVIELDWDSVAFGAPVVVTAETPLGSPEVGDGASCLIGCGAELPGVSVRILDGDGQPVPDGCLGEIDISGITVADGYHGQNSSSITAFNEGRVRTGDAGFIHRGELFVVGRLGDSIKVRGRTLYAEELEAKLAAINGVPRGRCVVLPAMGPVKGLVAIVEREATDWVEPAARLLRREAGRDAEVRILTSSPGTILRTSSGKPRRRVMWRTLVDGALDTKVAYSNRQNTREHAER